ncbi:hypothetical protein D187_000236 [Cystobacter fuscus DSM 2262]|uniref:Uncharacterized protein n=1 Tax=Cystobacter fuscus (strain ATCC 25194 / DSM 2262 / NBRC 100088 / M29) TaxID=1242864 RepID=S9QU04_CYSF2|nr:hypothetical protein [Cystobacter fuscus]EPX64814.1 hypothetical protein D187_000236 [Cystobacter fuscus DSM 2262]
MKFFIIAEDGGLPSASDLASYLNARWPGATVKPISNPERSYALEFHVPMADSRLEGLLHKTRGSMTFEGVPLREISEFVQWCRSLVPSHVSLLFCDESMNGEVKVTPTMSAAQILEAFHASGG